ncbi:probable glutathione S-transferase 8 isoform X1 [Watersipora subatra]|uniref:probable glutathione S-transferase 8 isoform X1 n=1 Tax=Watersipora subatra TaxID=2589382 RepID=UPI00355B5889
MAAKDKLTYFPVYARAESIRMLYSIAGVPFEDVRVQFDDWPAVKAMQPLGQLPVLECEEGNLVMSNSIARYVAKKLGLFGGNAWEEALNDMVMETCLECTNDLAKSVYFWLLFKRTPEPENSDKILETFKEKLLKAMNYVQSVAEKRGKTFILGDQISLADVWVFNTLQFSSKACSSALELTPWVKQFTESFQNDPKVKSYLETRPASFSGL